MKHPEDEEIDAKQVEIDQLAEAIAKTAEETASLKLHLASFERELEAVLALHYERLDRWKLRCVELRWIVAQLQERLQSQVHASAPSEPAWSDELDPQRNNTFQQEWADLNNNSAPHPEASVSPGLSSDELGELKDLYRALAKRFHPDLVNTSDARSARQNLMAEINSAYQDRDIARLRGYATHPDIPDITKETTPEKLVRLIREAARLRKTLKDAESELTSVKDGELGRLWFRPNVITELTQDIEEEISATKAEWATFRIQETELRIALDP